MLRFLLSHKYRASAGKKIVSLSRGSRRQTTIAQVAHKSMQKRNVSGIRAVVVVVVKMRPFLQLNKLQNDERRFHLSYYDLHTADAHIDLFELEVKRRTARPAEKKREIRTSNELALKL